MTTPVAEIEIRPATVDDYDAILALWIGSGLSIKPAGRDRPSAFARHIADFPGLTLVAVEGDRLVGVVLGTHDDRKGWINRLAVHPTCRRCGVGLALVDACDRAIRAAGIGIVAALIEPDNSPSAALLERLGYREDIPVRYFRKPGSSTT